MTQYGFKGTSTLSANVLKESFWDKFSPPSFLLSYSPPHLCPNSGEVAVKLLLLFLLILLLLLFILLLYTR